MGVHRQIDGQVWWRSAVGGDPKSAGDDGSGHTWEALNCGLAQHIHTLGHTYTHTPNTHVRSPVHTYQDLVFVLLHLLSLYFLLLPPLCLSLHRSPAVYSRPIRRGKSRLKTSLLIESNIVVPSVVSPCMNIWLALVRVSCAKQTFMGRSGLTVVLRLHSCVLRSRVCLACWPDYRLRVSRCDAVLV